MAHFVIVPSPPKPSVSSAARLLRETFVFRDLPEKALQRLAPYAREERFETDTVICAAGERLDLLRCITAGSIRPTRVSQEGVIVSSARRVGDLARRLLRSARAA
jgi:CRP-like cAMP-binding protein